MKALDAGAGSADERVHVSSRKRVLLRSGRPVRGSPYGRGLSDGERIGRESVNAPR
jgi:hypothetical protein